MMRTHSLTRSLVTLVYAISLIFALMTTAGCASFGKKLKSFLNGGERSEVQPARIAQKPTFSNSSGYMKGPRRGYRRMTREKLEEEAQLESNSGSLWLMEGQGAYLFSQNIIRMIGDPLAVKLEGEPRHQLESKVEIIAQLMQKLEQRRKAREDALAHRDKKAGDSKDEKSADNKEGQPGRELAGANAQPNPAQVGKPGQTPEEKAEKFSVQLVPTRVVERLVDGNYRVKGSQSFMIGSREYQVIVTGIVRAEDFNDEGVSAGQLLDPKFNIVSSKSKDATL